MKSKACSFDKNDIHAVEKARKGFLIHLFIYLIVVGSQWKIWLFSGGGYPFPIWVTFFWGLGIYSHYKKVYGYKNEDSSGKKDTESDFI